MNKVNEVAAKCSYEFDVRAFKPFTDDGFIKASLRVYSDAFAKMFL